MLRRFFLLALLVGPWFLVGCASEEQANDPNRVSTIPWNRPEKWESQGGLGGFVPNSQ